MIDSIALVALACGLFLVGGYLVGVRRAVEARDALRAELARAQSSQGSSSAEAAHVQRALAQAGERAAQDAQALGRAQAELERVQVGAHDALRAQDEARREALALRERLAGTESELAASRALAQRAEVAVTQAQAELKRLSTSAAQRRDADRSDLREVERILSPLLERERVAQAIQHIDIGGGTRGELPRLLDAIAQAGGLSALVLSDDSGLPLAASVGSERAEMLAGVWSQLLILADRVVEHGDPAPVAARFLDVDGRVLAHRIFSAGAQRFVLTAVARTGGLSPESLEPAVAKLERVLVRDAWQA